MFTQSQRSTRDSDRDQINNLKAELENQLQTTLRQRIELQNVVRENETLKETCRAIRDESQDVLRVKLKQQRKTISELERKLSEAKRSCGSSPSLRQADDNTANDTAPPHLGKRYLDVAMEHEMSERIMPKALMCTLFKRRFPQGTKYIPPSFDIVNSQCLSKLRNENPNWYAIHYSGSVDETMWRMFEFGTYALFINYMFYMTMRDSMAHKSNMNQQQIQLIRGLLMETGRSFVTLTEVSFKTWEPHKVKALAVYNDMEARAVWQVPPSQHTAFVPQQPPKGGESYMSYLRYQISDMLPDDSPVAPKNHASDRKQPNKSQEEIDPIVEALMNRA